MSKPDNNAKRPTNPLDFEPVVNIKPPLQVTDHEPEENAPLVKIKTNNAAVNSTIATVNKTVRQPMVAHLLRAAERFNDRMGNQFAAAITYFSFLSLIPVMMVAFAAGGYVLASHPTLLEDIFAKILESVSDPTLAATLKNTINTAVRQRTTVGLVGLLIALYSGVNWMGNLREAVRAQSRDKWERGPQDEEKFWIKYLRDFFSLIGLLLALIVTLLITSISGSAQTMLIDLLHLGGSSGLNRRGI